MTQGHPQVSSRELEAHAGQRTWVAFFGSQLVATAVILLPLIPAVQAALRVSVREMAIAIVPFIVLQVLCLSEFKRPIGTSNARNTLSKCLGSRQKCT